MPTGVNVYLLAARYAAGKHLATTTVLLSTTSSLLSVSAVLYLLQTLG
jgi:predicted permease